MEKFVQVTFDVKSYPLKSIVAHLIKFEMNFARTRKGKESLFVFRNA